MAAAAQPPARQLRLQIPPAVGQQQPFVYGENAPMFSPSLPTAINVGAHPGYPMQHQLPLHTPMQAQFFPRQPPGAPARPMHRPHPSVVQLAAAGILPPQGMPITPLGQVGFPGPMMPPQPFVPRSKRTQSVSTGGPPKAVLGGPQRKVTPIPVVVAAAAAAAPAAPAAKPKKVIVNLPKETVQEGEEKGTRQAWARIPLRPSEVPAPYHLPPPELTSAEPFPPDAWRHSIPPTVDVFLPGKVLFLPMHVLPPIDPFILLGCMEGGEAEDDRGEAGETWSRERVRQLRSTYTRTPCTSSLGKPHTSPRYGCTKPLVMQISSPADPALLYFKLNKLQLSQNGSASGSLAPSPQPPSLKSASPTAGIPPRFQTNRHGHSMSLAPTSSFYNPSAAFNPFGPSATLGSDQIFTRSSPGLPAPGKSESAPIHAPQGRVPTRVNSLAPPAPLSRPESKPDFSRGFGLVATAEVEEPPEEEVQEDASVTIDTADSADEDPLADGTSTVAQSRIHSRHVSKLSVALSLRSVGRVVDDVPEGDTTGQGVQVQEGEPEVFDTDAVEEWTGSEDMKETSDDEVR